MINYLFLDVDGILDDENGQLCHKKLSVLEQILFDNNAKIIVSSSWRKNNLEDTIVKFRNKGFPEQILSRIIGVTIRAYHYINNKKEIHLSIPRGVEVKQWLDVNVHSNNGKMFDEKIKGYHFNYIIIDDNNDFLIEQIPNLMLINSEFGLQPYDAIIAKDILSKSNVKYENCIECSSNNVTDVFRESFREITGQNFDDWMSKYKNISSYEDTYISSDGKYELYCDAYDQTFYLKKIIF